MLTRSQSQLRESVQRVADVLAFTDRHPPAAINDLLNRGFGALSRLCRSVNPEFQPLASATLTFDGVTALYGLPSNFRTLLSVEYDAAGDGSRVWLTPFELHERALLAAPDTTATRARVYRLTGDNIELLPMPAAGHTALLWYATDVVQLTSDASTAQTPDRLDDYVIWWAAAEIAIERGDWERHDRLLQKLSGIEADIRILARQRDVNAPGRPINMRFATDRYGRRVR